MRLLRFRSLVMLVAAVLVASSCGGDDEPAPTTSTSVFTVSTTTTLPPGPDFGLVAEFLNELAPRFGLPPEFTGERRRVSREFEADYVAGLRDEGALAGTGVDLDALSDDELLFLGYDYCLGIDFGADALTSVGVVAATAAQRFGREPAAAADADKALALAAARIAGGSICGEYRPQTEEMLRRVTGS